jgi:methionine synthase II (cobalamin-independent)
MFATLAGGLPRPTAGSEWSGSVSLADRIGAAIALQVELGLEPVMDGAPDGDPIRATSLGLDGVTEVAGGRPAMATTVGWSTPIHLARWQEAADRTDRAVKQLVGGPYSIGWRLAADLGHTTRGRLTLELAEGLREELRALGAAGCPLIQVDEPEAVRIGDSAAEVALFRDAQARLLDGVTGTHLSLAVTGGNVDAAGPAAFFDVAYASYLFDLIDGPDNWRLIAKAPADRGIVCGVVPGADHEATEKEVIVWAARYAAATMGRGLARVGLSTSGSLAGLTWDVARRRLELLALAADIAVEPAHRMVERLDRQAFRAAPRAPRVS